MQLPPLKFSLPAIYPITDTEISGLSVPEQVERLVAGGATLIQIREKKASSRDFLRSVEASIEIARPRGVLIIVNDRVDIAMVSKADGVHLGQTDLSPVYARKLIGDKAIIGYSTHTIEQAKAAVDLPIDYAAFGPVFATSTKHEPDPVVGTAVLGQVKKILEDVPLVAIGGINGANVSSVLDAGADSAAIVSGILSEADRIQENFSALISIARRN